MSTQMQQLVNGYSASSQGLTFCFGFFLVSHARRRDWLPLEFRIQYIQYKLAVLAFQHFEGMLPTYLSATLCTYKPAQSLRSSTERLLKSLRVNLKSAGERSFHFAAPAVWNLLPNSLGNIHSLTQFKSNLKLIFFVRLFWIHRCNLFVFIVCALWVLLKIVCLISTLHYYYYYHYTKFFKNRSLHSHLEAKVYLWCWREIFMHTSVHYIHTDSVTNEN